MGRRLSDWLKTYLEYAGVTESPMSMHYFAGVSAIAGALRRRVWIDMGRFRWTPNFFIVFVAPPGIVSKSTTADIAMDLLRQVPGIKFGPDVITWPALVSAFAASTESFQYGEDWLPMSALTLVASELGNLIQPQDRQMMNLYIELWDGRKSLEKVTKMSGSDHVEAPYINLLGCTTPHWLADNLPTVAVGGGFTSRCVFVYAEKKERFVAYVDEAINGEDIILRESLIHDLEWIATQIVGPYEIHPKAREWGRAWYEALWTTRPPDLDDERFDGYIARKQTHLHKLAIVLAASRSDERVILPGDLAAADLALTSVEPNLEKVFSRIGRSEESANADRVVRYLERRGECTYADTIRYLQSSFPDLRDIEGVLAGLIKSNMIAIQTKENVIWVRYVRG